MKYLKHFRHSVFAVVKLGVVALMGASLVGCSNPLGSGDSKIDEDYNPGAPISLTAPTVSVQGLAAQVVLAWTAASSNRSPLSYKVLRSESASGPFSELGSDLTGLSYSDATATPGTTYYYKVQSLVDGKSADSEVIPATPMTTFSITGATALSSSSVALTWGAVTGATTYTVTYGTSSGVYPIVASSTATSPFTVTGLTQGVIYYFMVTANNATGSVRAAAEMSAITMGAPLAPSSVALTLTDASEVTLNWSAVTGTSVTYNVLRGTNSGGPYSTTVCAGVSVTTCEDGGVVPGTTYFYVVRTVTPGGTSSNSTEVTGVPLGAFTLSSLTAGNGTMVVNFASSQGATTYRVLYGTSSGNATTLGVSGAASPLMQTGLTNATTYFVKIRASNAYGSLESTNELSDSPVAPPSTPTGLAATASPGQVVLNWNASTGTGPITYLLRRRVGVGAYTDIGTTTSLSWTDASVVAGTTYDYVVIASNVGGSSAASTAAIAMPIASFSITSVSVGSGSINLSWNAPTGATTYSVRRSTSVGTSAAGTVVCTGSGTSCADSGLTNGTTYYYTVIAANSAGQNSTSTATSNERSGVPLAAPWVSAVAGTGQVVFTWNDAGLSAPFTIKYSSTSGGAATGANLTGCDPSGSTTTCTGTGLTNGTLYYFVLQATQGMATYTSPEIAATPISSFTISSATATSSSAVDLAWTNATGETAYAITYGTSSGSYPFSAGSAPVNATSATISGLTAGTTYYFMITATNSVGVVQGTPERSVTMPTVATAPTSPALAITQASQLDLSWTASASGTAPITYTVFRSTSASSGFAALAGCINQAGTSCQDSTATPGITYYYKIQASNLGGNSPDSSTVSGVALGAFTMSGVATTSATTSQVSWGASSGASTYSLSRGTSTGSHPTLVSASATSPQAVTGLTGGTTYYYLATAANATGSLVATAETSAAQPTVPSALTLTGTIAATNRTDFSWTASSGSAPITYTLQRSTSSGSGFSNVTGCVGLSATTCQDTTAVGGTTYFYKVVATGPGGSADSNEVSLTPIANFSPTITAGNRQLTVTFAASGASSYNLKYGTSAGVYSTTVTGATSPHLITGLTNGTMYYVAIEAVNGAGTALSAEGSGTPNGPQPFSLSAATPGNGQVTLTWGASAGATSYNVRYGTGSGSYGTTFATGVTGTSSTVTGLTNGTTYYFMVTAVNASGTQDAGNELNAIPAQPTLSLVANANYDATNNQFVTPTMASNWNANIGFTLGGHSSLTCDGNLTASSSNTAVVSNGAFIWSGTYPNCNLNLAVAGGASGSTTITVTATRGAASAVVTFAFYVLPTPAVSYSTRKSVMGYTGQALRVRRSSDNAEQDIGFDAFGNLNKAALNSFLGISTYPLDDMSVAAAAAYSLRKLRTAYTGAAFRVRRSSDNAEQDIGFTNAGDLDQSALLAFVGGENYILHSDDYSNATWSKANATVSGTTITSTSSGAVAAGISQVVAIPAGSNSFSIDIHTAGTTSPWVRLAVTDGGTTLQGWANLSTGALGNVQAGMTITSTAITGGFRFTVARTTTSASITVFIRFADTNNSMNAPTSGSTMVVANTRVNTGSVARTYVATTTTALSGNGFVRTWYDQSGNSLNATQTTANNQPRIVSAGVVDTDNGRPSIRQLTSQWLNIPHASGASYSLNYVARYTGGTGRILSGVGSITPFWTLGWYNGQYVRAFFREAWVVAQTNTGDFRAVTSAMVSSGVIAGVFSNGTSQSLGGDLRGGGYTSLNTNGQQGATNESSENYFSEFTVYNSSLSTANRQILEISQSGYYGITYATALPSAFVTTWYDQSGNGRNLTNAVTANQPRIVSSGTYNNWIDFSVSGNSGALCLSSNLTTGFVYTTISVWQAIASSGGIIWGSPSGTSQYTRITGGPAANVFTPGFDFGSSFSSAGNGVVATWIETSSNSVTGYVNNVLVGSTNSATVQGGFTSGLGCWNSTTSATGNAAWRGKEFYIFGSALNSSDRTAIEILLKNYFGI